MRLLLDSMIVLMLVGIAVGVVVYQKSVNRRAHNQEVVVQGLSEFQEQVTLHGAIEMIEDQEAALYPRLYPPHIEPHWFQAGAPQNPLISSDRPWLDIAPEEDFSDQPPDPLASSQEQAAFWYNPNNGVVRARVPRQVSDRLTLELYNTVNHTALSLLPDDRDPERIPFTFNPSPTSTGQLASLVRRTVGHVHADEPVEQALEPDPEPTPWWLKPPTSTLAPQPVITKTDEPKRASLLSP